MRKQLVYLALGSNLGDRNANLRAAITALPPRVSVLSESCIYETEPWGFASQPAFLNMAVKAETRLAPLALLQYLKKLEKMLGRTPSFRYGPRQIDIDILFYGDMVFEAKELVIPHPHLHERSFVLVPLMDIAPDVTHPVLRKTVREMLSTCDTRGVNRHG